ncbi:selenide, water dikinase SelD, partial [Mesobacterium pallidum]|uniref:selenide, water dikinase SelD n=1 Tax=Mesobacterium pallidum TaxID=2872037 RepID=UPI001EE334F8
RPQKGFLKLVSLGGKTALADKAGFAPAGPLLWRWKDRIDRRFMAMLQDLPQMAPPALPDTLAEGVSEILADKPLCGGCGAKIGGDVLTAALADLPPLSRPDILSGPGDDAAVLQTGGAVQVMTTDHLRSFVEDPALMARITALHALGDIWAMGARPQAALAQIILPRMSPALQRRTMDEIMTATRAVLDPEGAALVGGHSTMGAELTIGFTLTGLCDGPALTVAGAQPGDALVLTRPIGSGTLLAAEMLGKARGRDIATLWAEMARPQGAAARELGPVAHAMTDVTGFGLAGHALAIALESGVAIALDLEAIPLYDGALEMSGAGQHSTLFRPNALNAPVFGADPEDPRARLLWDPQTAGGLLAAVPETALSDLLHALHAAGEMAVHIGDVEAGPPSLRLK